MFLHEIYRVMEYRYKNPPSVQSSIIEKDHLLLKEGLLSKVFELLLLLWFSDDQFAELVDYFHLILLIFSFLYVFYPDFIPYFQEESSRIV
jgi:hypothetical protein